MAKISNRQLVLKPQDLFVLLALLSRGEGAVTYLDLAAQTGLAVSAVHGALKRAVAARLLIFQERRPVILKAPPQGVPAERRQVCVSGSMGIADARCPDRLCRAAAE
ncbi:hypothetical protein MASR1M97_21570 [Candidatus Desulfobacillus denitrificans]